MKAGTLTVKNIINGNNTRTLAFGKRYRYEPSTPAMAPEAPIKGVEELISKIECEIVAKTPEIK